jgi:hypothetical protein
MYVAKMIEKMKISGELKKRIEAILEEDDTYSLELQDYLQKIYKIERETIDILRSKEAEEQEK